MSCYECIHGPNPCEKWTVEGHTMLCQETKDFLNFKPAPPGEVDTDKCVELAEKQVSEITNSKS